MILPPMVQRSYHNEYVTVNEVYQTSIEHGNVTCITLLHTMHI